MILFLILGAIINVAVAWGCVIGGPAPKRSPSQIAKQTASDFFGYPNDWPQQNEVHTIGYHQVPRSAGEMMQNHPLWHSVVDVTAGWPALALKGELRGRYANDMQTDLPPNSIYYFAIGRSKYAHPLPLKPIWPGFVLNSTFFALALGVLFFGPKVPLVIRRRRIRRGLCPKCAYPIGVSDTCTECGRPVKRKIIAQKAGAA